MATRTTPQTREILVVRRDGTEVIVGNIPANAKITFGPVSPGQRDYNTGNAVRIYTSASNQLAVFEGAQSFRDLSLSIQEKVVTTTEESESEIGAGRNKRRASREATAQWVPVPR